MDRWEGRVALVTGASSGVGAAVAKLLAQGGMKVVGIARNTDKIEEISNGLKETKGKLVALKCDLTNDEAIKSVFETIKVTYGGVDVCVNCAGMSFNTCLLDGNPTEWRYMMDINVISICLCTKLAVASMRERGVDDGHIININSTSGHQVIPPLEFNFYSATKFALTAISEGLRQELRAAKSHIRVSSISPGSIDTSFFSSMMNDEAKVADYFSDLNPLTPEDVAKAVLYILTAPRHVEVNDIVMRPTEESC